MRLLGGPFPYTVKVGFSMALPRSQKFRENVEAADFMLVSLPRRWPLWEFSYGTALRGLYGIFLTTGGLFGITLLLFSEE